MLQGHPESGNGVPEHREYKDGAAPESVGPAPQHRGAGKESGESCSGKARLVCKSEEPT
jgi:hypothetical protein